MITRQTSHSTPGASRRLDAVITLLGILGLVLFLAFYDRAFPSAAIELSLSRSEILQRARTYLEARGYELQDYESALTFHEAWWASVYLQRTLGIPETNRLVRAERIPIWYWRVRWFRPLQKEEFSVSLSTSGEVVAFYHSIMEDAPGDSLAQDDARISAEGFLMQDRHWALEDWEPITVSTQDQPGGRTDHHFEWKRRGFAVGEGELRLAVDVLGDEVGGYGFWLKVPETFQRHFAEQSNRAAFFSNLSSAVGFIGFSSAAFLAYLVALRRGVLQWHSGLGPALAVAVISLLAGLNYLPLSKAWYGTTQGYAMFWLEQVFDLLYSAAYTAITVLVLWAGGQRLSKTLWPRRDKILPRSLDRWAVLASSGWRGLMLGGLSAGYVVVFYLLTTRFLGGWTPLGSPYTSAFATPLPFLGPLASGLLPATQEELLFRLIGVSVLLWLTRRRSLALLVPGALWAFAHLGYVRAPFYLRGIELLVPAVFLEGWFFLRFDLTTTIVAHFAYNAGLTALPLLRSGEPYFVASGLVVILTMLAPLIPGAVSAARRRLRGADERVPTPRITTAVAEDLQGLAALPVEGLDWARLLADPHTVVLGLRAAEEIVGVAAGRVHDDGVGEVLTVYVAPAWRRQYWGSNLAHELGIALQQRHAQSLSATVGTEDRIAAIFWASQGWRSAVKVFSRSLLVSSRPSWRRAVAQLRRAVRSMLALVSGG